MTARVHIVGAGMAGLSCAVRLIQAGKDVTLYEAAPHAGGRCRSFYDETLKATIDNGAHLMMSGNTDLKAYLGFIGALDQVYAQDRARFDFVDVSNTRSWSIDLGCGRGQLSLLGWIFDAKRRPPGVGPWTLLREILALKTSRGKTVSACLDASRPHFKTFWEPLCLAILNAVPDEAAAALLWAVFEETVLLGGAAARPLFTKNGLGAALVDPAVNMIKDNGGTIRLGCRVVDFETTKGRVSCLNFSRGAEVLREHDVVVFAVPHFVLSKLIPSMMTPGSSHAIVNIHFRLPISVCSSCETILKGVVGSFAQWVFARGDIASVTISAADEWVDKDVDDVARSVWPDVVKVLELDDSKNECPAFRVIKERRATFAQSIENSVRRSGVTSAYANAFVAGDWSDTKLPATLEGAVRSGRYAAEAVVKVLLSEA